MTTTPNPLQARIVRFINHGNAPVRLHQFKADVPHVDITIPANVSRSVFAHSSHVENLLGLASMAREVSALVHVCESYLPHDFAALPITA